MPRSNPSPVFHLLLVPLQVCARYAGLFKSAVSAGMTVSFGVTAAEVCQIIYLSPARWLHLLLAAMVL